MSQPLQLDQILPPMNDSNGNSILPTTLPATSAATQVTLAARELICRFKTADNLLGLFNPSKQIDYTLDQRRAYLGKAPTLGLVGKSFAYGTAKSWTAIQLWDLAEFAGCRTKLAIEQIEELSKIICNEYGYLKLTELMDFFRRFKSGEYGKFYGAVDPMVITCALREFIKSRNAILAKFAKQDEEARRRNDPERIKYLQRYKARERLCCFYAANFRSKDFTMDDFAEIWWLFNLGYERKNHGYNEW